MKLIVKVILIALLAYILQMFLPWWAIAISSFVVNAIIHTKAGSSFLAGFLGVFVLWFIAAWRIDAKTDSLLTQKMAELFFVNEPLLLILITAFIGGLVGGLAGLAGSTLKGATSRRRKDRYYG